MTQIVSLVYFLFMTGVAAVVVDGLLSATSPTYRRWRERSDR